MTVYVDDMLKDAAVRNGDHTVRGRWSHLMADTTSELLDFAAGLGLHRSWLQKPGSPLEHFDITAGKRLRALELGAVQITYGEAGHLTRAKRAGVTFDLQLLRENPRAFEGQPANGGNMETPPEGASTPLRRLTATASTDSPGGHHG